MKRTFVVLAAAVAASSLAVAGCHSSSTGAAASSAEGGAANPSDLPNVGSLSAFLTSFEGEIDVQATSKGGAGGAPQTVPLALFVKSGKLRADIPVQALQGGPGAMLGPKAYAIFDSAAKKLYVVADQRHEVIVIDLDKSGEQFKSFKAPSGPHEPNAPAGPPPTPTKVVKTGKYDTVAGYKCENWDIQSDHKEGTACVAQEGVSWFSLPITGIPTEHAWAFELLDGKHFPLRFVGYERDGATESGRLEVTKIDKKTLADTEFQYPPTYKVVDLAQMMAGFGAFGGMPGGMPPGVPMGAPGGMPPGMPPGMKMPPGMAAPAHSHR